MGLSPFMHATLGCHFLENHITMKLFMQFLVVSFVCSIALSMCLPKKEGPAFCHGLECPEFKLISQTKDYELRDYYVATNWVATKATSDHYKDVKSVMFYRLLHYITGKNAANQKISMTLPIFTAVEPGKKNCNCHFLMFFFLPSDKNPKPTEDGVFLVTYKPFLAYVRTFTGYASNQDWKHHIKILKEAVGERKYDHSYSIMATYDNPWHLLNRHNEVWLVVE